jgi:cytochrome b
MIVLLLLILTFVVLTGLFSADEDNAGPFAHLIDRGLAGIVADVHEGLTSVLGWLVGFHVVAVFADWLITGDNLIRAMWTGAKTVPADSVVADAVPAPFWRLALALLASVLVLALLVA